MEKQRKSIYCTGNMLIQRFKFCTVDTKKMLFMTYMYNMYGCHLWSNFLKVSYNKVKVAYNNICRYLMKLGRMESMSTFMIYNQLFTFQELIRKCSYGFYMRLCSSDNVIIRAIFYSMQFLGSKLNAQWCKNLYTCDT